jgi:hypothetical protein
VCGAIEVAKQNKYLPNVVVMLQIFHLLSGLWLFSTQRSSLQRKEAKIE